MNELPILLNGAAQTAADGETVADLLARLDLEPRRVAVEINAQLVRRVHFAETKLAANDRIEIVTLVGGG